MVKQCKAPDNVKDKALYCKIKEKVKKRVKVWPSAYASGQVVTEYKNAGGRYIGDKEEGDLARWYKEKWVNVCQTDSKGQYLPCGRKESNRKKYPYCRPSKRITSDTPMTADEFKKKYGKKELEKMCSKKRTKGLPIQGKPTRIRKD